GGRNSRPTGTPTDADGGHPRTAPAATRAHERVPPTLATGCNPRSSTAVTHARQRVQPADTVGGKPPPATLEPTRPSSYPGRAHPHPPSPGRPSMTRKLRNELRFLRLYVVFTVPVLALLLFAAISDRTCTPYFEAITVKRINVVEPDGTRKLVIASCARQTEVRIGGVQFPVQRSWHVGMIFFNDSGDGVGGLAF